MFLKIYNTLPNNHGILVSWVLVFLAILCNLFAPIQIALWLICSAIFFRFWDCKLGINMLLPLFLIIVLPFHRDYLHLILGLPLSIISATCTAFTLNLLGYTAMANGAIIFVNGEQIAITSACSGIALLEIMLILGYIIIRLEHKKISLQIVQYLSIIPIIILSNSLRLIIMTIFFLKYGEEFFQNPWHTFAGFSTVVLAMVFLLLTGKAIS